MPNIRFPLFNTLIVTIIAGAIGYYLSNLLPWLIGGAAFGFIVGLIVEWTFSRGPSWLYKRRVLFLAVVQMLGFVFGVGPYAFVLMFTQPMQGTLCCTTPTDFGAINYEDVRINVADRVTLAGWYVPPPDDSGAVIMLLHGSGGTRLGTYKHAAVLYEAGYGLLMYDQRALGESTGDKQSWGWLDIHDIPYVVDFLLAKPEVVRIGAVGLSLGGHILMASVPYEDRIDAYWLDGIGPQVLADMPPPRNPGEVFLYLLSGSIENWLSFHVGANVPTPFNDIIGTVNDPMMLVAAGADDNEPEDNHRLYLRSSDSVQLWVIPEAQHVGGLGVAREQYIETMTRFFDEALKRT